MARLVARKTEPLVEMSAWFYCPLPQGMSPTGKVESCRNMQEKLLTRVQTARSEFKQIDSFDYGKSAGCAVAMHSASLETCLTLC